MLVKFLQSLTLAECSTLIASNTSIAMKSIWYDVKITWIQDACKWLHFINSNQKSVNSLNLVGAKQNIGPLFGCGLDLGGESWILKVSEKLLWSFILLSSPLCPPRLGGRGAFWYYSSIFCKWWDFGGMSSFYTEIGGIHPTGDRPKPDQPPLAIY